MHSNKTYNGKINIIILKYSTLYKRTTMHCNIYSVKPPSPSLTHKDDLSKGGRRAPLSSAIHGFCSNKALYSASLSFTIFFGPVAITWWFLQKRVSPSFPLCGYFYGKGSLLFSKFGHVARNLNKVVHDRTRFF